MHPHPRQNNTFTGLSGGQEALFAAPHRFSFNGKESDSEVKGEGNQQDYGMRIYDNRLGRFLSVDPLMKSYPWYTPFQFAGNNPIKFIDLDGLEEANPAKQGENKNGVQTSAIDNTRAGYTNQYYLQRYYTPPPAPLPPDPGTIRQDGVLGNPQFQQFKWQVDHGAINFVLPIDLTKKIINGEEISSTEVGIEILGIVPLGKIVGSGLKSIIKVGSQTFEDIASFYQKASRLSTGERVALFKMAGKQFAKENNWTKNINLMKINKGRTIYTDSNNINYSLDTKHGRFEILDKNGKHQGELDFNGKITKGADPSGGHDIQIN